MPENRIMIGELHLSGIYDVAYCKVLQPTHLLSTTPETVTLFKGIENVETIEFIDIKSIPTCLNILENNKRWAAKTIRFGSMCRILGITEAFGDLYNELNLILGPNVTHIECLPHSEYGGKFFILGNLQAPAAISLNLNWFELKSLSSIPPTCTLLSSAVSFRTLGLPELPASIKELTFCGTGAVSHAMNFSHLKNLESLYCYGSLRPIMTDVNYTSPLKRVGFGWSDLKKLTKWVNKMRSAGNFPFLRGLEIGGPIGRFISTQFELPTWVEEVSINMYGLVKENDRIIKSKKSLVRMLASYGCVYSADGTKKLSPQEIIGKSYSIIYPKPASTRSWESIFNHAILEYKRALAIKHQERESKRLSKRLSELTESIGEHKALESNGKKRARSFIDTAPSDDSMNKRICSKEL